MSAKTPGWLAIGSLITVAMATLIYVFTLHDWFWSQNAQLCTVDMEWTARKGDYCYDNAWPRHADLCEARDHEGVVETASRCGLDPQEWWRGRTTVCGNTALDHVLCTWVRDLFVPNWNAYFAAPKSSRHKEIFAAAIVLFFGFLVKKAIDLFFDFIKEAAASKKDDERTG
jgi:hypothetical protein